MSYDVMILLIPRIGPADGGSGLRCRSAPICP
jgi:hypothetical protein